jgi:hypothetical protein
MKINLLEVCQENERYEKEQYWIDFYKSINKADAGKGPKNFMPDEKELLRRKNQMILNRKNNPEMVKKALENSLKSNHLKYAGEKGRKKILDLKPLWSAKCKKTGKIYGPYKGYQKAVDELKISYDSINKTLYKNNSNRKYIMNFLEV